MNLEGRNGAGFFLLSCLPDSLFGPSHRRVFAVQVLRLWKQKRLGPDWGARRGASGSNGLRTLSGSRCVDRGGNHAWSEAGSRPGRQRDFPAWMNSEDAKTRRIWKAGKQERGGSGLGLRWQDGALAARSAAVRGRWGGKSKPKRSHGSAVQSRRPFLLSCFPDSHCFASRLRVFAVQIGFSAPLRRRPDRGRSDR